MILLLPQQLPRTIQLQWSGSESYSLAKKVEKLSTNMMGHGIPVLSLLAETTVPGFREY